jgi:hypothetical protein
MYLARWVSLVAVCACVCAATGAHAAAACTDTWTNPAGGSWTDASGWSTGQVPGPADDACIATGRNDTLVVASGTVTVHSLTVQSGTFKIHGDVTFNGELATTRNVFLFGTVDVLTKTLTVNGDLDMSTGGHIEVGIKAADTFGVLNVTGAASVQAGMVVRHHARYRPDPGASFPVLTAGSFTGFIGKVDKHRIHHSGGLDFVPTYPGDGVTLVVVDSTP